jgi:putative membrane protein
LPYQIVRDLGWWTVPAVVVASFALLGILGIGWEIENPFGYDDNDLVIKIRYLKDLTSYFKL